MLKRIILLIHVVLRFQRGNSLQGRCHRKVKSLMISVLRELQLKEYLIKDRLVVKARWYAVQLLWLKNEISFIYNKSNQYNDEAAVYCGLAFGLSDYLIDDKKWSKSKLLEIIFPESLNNKEWIEEVYIHCYKKFLNSLNKNRDSVHKLYESTFKAQINSADQLNQDVSKEEIDKLTADKCGVSMHLGMALADKWIPKDLETWYQLGAFVQFCNDIQDLRKDLLGKVRSFATERTSFYSMGEDLINQYNKCVILMPKLKIRQSKKKYLSFQYYLFLLGTITKLYYFQGLISSYDPVKMTKVTKYQVRITPLSWITVKFVMKNLKYWEYYSPVTKRIIKGLYD